MRGWDAAQPACGGFGRWRLVPRGHQPRGHRGAAGQGRAGRLLPGAGQRVGARGVCPLPPV